PDESNGLGSLTRALGEFLSDIRPAENMLVLKTPPGAPQPLAAAVDGAKFGEIAGTIAGDDTVLIITPDKKSRESLQRQIESLVRPRTTARQIRRRLRLSALPAIPVFSWRASCYAIPRCRARRFM